ncbi:unnamed protein product [Amoebophrya sp. A25]|nr:unnamed protein product [Amoebophrya sp. A25]|eukprot:GSA25T00025177001.1
MPMRVQNPLQRGAGAPAPGTVVPRLNPESRLLLGPGPQNADPRVHAAMALPQIGHMDPDFLRIMEDIKMMLRYMWQTENAFTVPVSGTGSAAWEAAIANLTEQGDKHLICVNGYFGERALDMHSRFTDVVEKIQKNYGEPFTPEEIRAALEKHKPKLMWLCHAETSTGMLQDRVGEIGKLCRQHDCLLMLDTVTSICGAPIYLDDWRVDAAYAGGQKCMGCPPGISALSLGPRALAKLENRKGKVKSWYLDMSMIKKYMMDTPAPAAGGGQAAPPARVYHHTAPISMAYAMREALTNVAEEGLENSWARHQKTAAYFRKAVTSPDFLPTKNGQPLMKPLELLPLASQNQLPALTLVKVPAGIDGKQVVKQMREEFEIEIGAALGQFAGKYWRIGFMGYNSSARAVAACLSALRKCIDDQANAQDASTRNKDAVRSAQVADPGAFAAAGRSKL